MSVRDQSRFDNPHVEPLDADTMSAREAAQVLGVKRATLYTYVSRGLVRRVPGEDGRSKRYLRSDILRLKTQHDARAGHSAAAAGALRWGQPVLDSSVTAITPDGPAYRGRLATRLVADGKSVEEVSSVLWACADEVWPAPEGPGADPVLLAALLPEASDPLTPLTLAIPAMAARDPHRHQSAPDAELARARVLIARCAAWIALPRGPEAVQEALRRGPGVAEVVACALGCEGERATRAVEAALILCADHELNVSAFTARVAASSSADLYACCAAALAALSGPRHGGTWRRILALLEEAEFRQQTPAQVAQARIGRAEAVPGFGHTLYPQGDPRAWPLLLLARRRGEGKARVVGALELVEWMSTHGYGEPTVDLGLVVLCEALGLGASAAVCLFAIGRMVGWVAHIMEQRQSPHLLRPRARYAGEGV